MTPLQKKIIMMCSRKKEPPENALIDSEGKYVIDSNQKYMMTLDGVLVDSNYNYLLDKYGRYMKPEQSEPNQN